MTRRKALVIGIDKYPESPLRNCESDAQEVGDILGFPEYNFEVKTLLNANATRREILGHLNELFEDEPEFAVFYFAGHGMTNELTTYLVSVDTDDIDPGIDLDYLRRLVKSRAGLGRSIIILLDCCHSGSANIRSSRNTNLRFASNQDIDSLMHSLGSSTVVIAACQPQELAYEEPSLEHGVFTFYLLEGMYGDAADHNGSITALNLYEYVSQRLEKVTNQTPVFKGDIIGRNVLATGLKPRDATVLPSDEARRIEITAENMINEYIQLTSVDLSSWDRNVYKHASSALEPKLRWFNKQLLKYPSLSKSQIFKSAFSTAQAKRADLGHLKEGLNAGIGTIGAKLGSGTFGTVWQVKTDENYDLAYKVYHPMDLENQEKLARFYRGYRAMQQLDHPHVVKVYSYTECPIGFTMQLIKGPNLRDFVYMDANPEEIIHQLLDVGETLKHAHSRGVIHRDVKPENIIVSSEKEEGDTANRPYLTDFDLAWFSTATQFTKEGVGSLIYAAPEQLSKPQSNVAHAVTTDVYAFGQLCFFFLCRRDPVPGLADNSRALRESVITWSTEEPAQKMVQLYEQCTQIKPGNRIQDFRDLCDQLFEIHQLITEHDHRRIIGFDRFAKQLMFSIIGLSPDWKISDTVFFTKTRHYRVSMNYSDASRGKCTIGLEIFAEVPHMGDGSITYQQRRRKLNRRIDSVLKSYQNRVVRRAGKVAPFSITLFINKIQLNTDGVEFCRQILMRVINCLEGN
ncbi:MAG: caspase family protein [bacterium]